MEIAFTLLLRTSLYFLKLYFLMLVLRILLYWFPNISYYEQPFYSLVRVTDPYLKLFKDVVPSIFGMDISPLFAFMFLQILMEILPRLVASFYF